MKGVNVLYDFGKYIIFHDPMTDYIWIYNTEMHNAVYIFKFVNKLKKFFKIGGK